MFESINTFRQKLRSGQPCLGTGITFTDPMVIDALADSVDFFWIDQEHTGMSIATIGLHLMAARGKGVAALVRVVSSATAHIKPVLDMGAEAIIVPQIKSAAEVQGVVDDCCYPPLGRRGFGPRVPTNYGRDSGPDYLRRANEGVFIVAQIETAGGYAELDQILAIPRLDSIVLGPWDFSGALGLLGQVEHPEVVKRLESVIQRTRAAGKFIGSGLGSNVEMAQTMIRRGVQWMQVGGDYDYMVRFADRNFAAVRGAQGGERGKNAYA